MRVIQTLGWPADELNCIEWLSNDCSIATGSDDGSIRLWSENTSDSNETNQPSDYSLDIKKEFRIHESSVKAIISTSNDLLIAGSSDCTISIWDIKSGALVKRISGFQDWVRGIASSPDESKFAAVSADQTLHIYSLIDFTIVTKICAHNDIIRAVDWSPDGKKIATACADGSLKIWDANSFELLNTSLFRLGLTCVQWDKDSIYLAVAGVDRGVSLVHSETSEISAYLEGHRDTVLSLSWNWENDKLISGSADRTFRIWDMPTRKCIQIVEGHKGSVRCVKWSTEGTKVASVSTDRSLRTWECVPYKNQIRLICDSVSKARKDWVRCAKYYPERSVIALGMDDRATEIIRIEKSTKILMRMESSTSIGFIEGALEKVSNVIEKRRARVEEWVRSIDWNPSLSGNSLHKSEVSCYDLGLIAITSDDAGVKLVHLGNSMRIRDDIFQGKIINEFSNKEGNYAFCLKWSHDGSLLGIAMDNSLYVWNHETDQSTQGYLTELNLHTNQIIAIAWDKDSTKILSSSLDYRVIEWNLANQTYRELQQTDAEILSLDISPDNKLIAGSGSDSCVYIWERKSLKILNIIPLHIGPIVRIKWENDSNFLVTSSQNGCIKILEKNSWRTIWMLPAPQTPHLTLDLEICYKDFKGPTLSEINLDGKAVVRSAIIPQFRSTKNIINKVFFRKQTQEEDRSDSVEIENTSIDLNMLLDQMKPDKAINVFISYAREDRNHALPLYLRLKNMGFNPWIDEFDALPGIEWREEFPKQVKNSDIVLICMTELSTRKNGYLQKELRVALESAQERPAGDVYIIPIRFEPCEIPSSLANYQSADLFEQNGWNKLFQTLHSKAVQYSK